MEPSRPSPNSVPVGVDTADDLPVLPDLQEPPPLPPFAMPAHPFPPMARALPALPTTFDASTIRQWRLRVRRNVRSGLGREEILYGMTDANWPLDQAQK